MCNPLIMCHYNGLPLMGRVFKIHNIFCMIFDKSIKYHAEPQPINTGKFATNLG